MKVKELIAELEKLNPDEDIMIYHSMSGTYDRVYEVIPAGIDDDGHYPASLCP